MAINDNRGQIQTTERSHELTTEETPRKKLTIDIDRDVFEEIDGYNILDKQEINHKIRESRTPRENQSNVMRLNDKVELQNFNGQDCPITIN